MALDHASTTIDPGAQQQHHEAQTRVPSKPCNCVEPKGAIVAAQNNKCIKALWCKPQLVEHMLVMKDSTNTCSPHTMLPWLLTLQLLCLLLAPIHCDAGVVAAAAAVLLPEL
jgi:hypothetical protein